MSLQCPECPQSTEELENLLYALTNSRLDLTPEEYEQQVSEKRKEIMERGISEEDSRVLLLSQGLDSPSEEFRKDYERILKWGGNRKTATVNFLAHHFFGDDYVNPDEFCQQCSNTYRELRKKYVGELAQLEKVNITDREQLEKLVLQADWEFFGFPVNIPY